MTPDTPFTRARRIFRFWRRDIQADVSDEVQFHIDECAAEGIAHGLSEDAARAAALRRFGDVDRIAGTLRDLSAQGDRIMHRKEWFDAVAQDVRFGLRQLRKNPGFTIVALLTLALGIGANTAIFSIVHSVLLRPLPFRQADRLMDLHQLRDDGTPWSSVTFGSFSAWETRARSFDAIGAALWENVTLTGTGNPERLRAQRVTFGYWRARAIPPVLGRYFDQDADRPGAPPVAVLSYSLWIATFGADSSIIGKTIYLDGKPYNVVAVAARGHSLSSQSPQLWEPMALGARDRMVFNDHELAVTGLLRTGITQQQAVAELASIERDISQAHPEFGVKGAVLAIPLLDAVVGTARRQYMILLGAVGLVLLLACGNVANLTLARAATRRTELAMRSALGAGRGRIIGQLLVESGTLAIGGAILGLGVGALGIRVLIAASPPGVPRLQDATLDAPVLGFTIGLAILAGVLCGLAPAVRASRADLQHTLRDARRGTHGHVRDGLRHTLIVAEVAIALVLLTGAGLLLRSAHAMQRVPLHLNPAQVLTARIGLPGAGYPDATTRTLAFKRIVEDVRAIPGVTSAGMISRLPLATSGADCGVRRIGPDTTQLGAQFRSVTPDYFSTMRIPLLAGRTFAAADEITTPLVVMMNASLAHRLFGSANPIGQRVAGCINPSDHRPGDVTWEVIGIVADVPGDGLTQPVPDQVFYSYTQYGEAAMTLAVRGNTSASAMLPAVRERVRAIDAALPLAGVATMAEVLTGATATPRFTTLLLLLLGITGLLLAAVGIYGVIAHFASQRTHELGVRMALGATTNRVLLMVLRQGFLLALAGVAVGEVAGFAASSLLADQVYGVSVRDPVTFATVPVILTAIALLASLVPAWRATRVDPLTALRA